MPERRAALDQPFSIYLDLVRFLAALLVVLMHFRQFGIASGEAALVFPMLGREAVVGFFVLSGFVIAHTTRHRHQGPLDYAVARCARLYSVALPVLLLAFAAAALLHGLPGAKVSSDYQLLKPYLYIPFHLLFLGEMWQFREVPPWLLPWWSLNYEAWYYVLFGIAFYLRGAKRLLVGSLVLAVMGLKLWLLLPVWLSGVVLYHWLTRQRLPLLLARLGWLASLGLLVAYEASGLEPVLRQAGRDLLAGQPIGLGNADRYLSDYVVALLVCLNFACARDAGFAAMMKLARPVRTLASYTFTLYLVHAVVLGAWPLLYPHDPNDPLDWLAAAVAVGLATWVLGMLTEQRKHEFRAAFERLAEQTKMCYPWRQR